MKKKYLLTSLILFGCCFISTASAQQFAEMAEGITISPPLLEETLKPGETVTHKIQVTNPTKNLVELYPSAADFQSSGEGGEPNFSVERSQFSMSTWITFTQPVVALLPQQVVEFTYQIAVPENAEPGGHYGVVFLSTKPPELSGGASQMALSSRVGSLLLIRVPGEVREQASLEEYFAPWFYFKPPVSFAILVRNMGNVHIKPTGDLVIKNWRGEEAARLPVNAVKGNVLPESKRRFDLVWEGAQKPFWKIPLGKFSASVQLAYGQEQKSLNQTIYFWMIPWWVIIGLSSFFFLLVIIMFWIFFRNRKKRKREEFSAAGEINKKNPEGGDSVGMINTNVSTNSSNFSKELVFPESGNGGKEDILKKEMFAQANIYPKKLPSDENQKTRLPINEKQETEKKKNVMRF